MGWRQLRSSFETYFELYAQNPAIIDSIWHFHKNVETLKNTLQQHQYWNWHFIRLIIFIVESFTSVHYQYRVWNKILHANCIWNTYGKHIRNVPPLVDPAVFSFQNALYTTGHFRTLMFISKNSNVSASNTFSFPLHKSRYRALFITFTPGQ